MLEKALLQELQEYVDSHLLSIELEVLQSDYMEKRIFEESIHIEMEDFVKNKLQPTFVETLFHYIDKKECKDAEVYKKAGMDRRHFSKIRSNPDYKPRKNTVIALALALELSQHETDQLLAAAGYSLSESETFDLVIQFCIERNIYNLHDVNEALDYFSLKPLSGVSN